MRKYHQALLAVIAVVSLISLLIYRHEYNKLRYVLEVFNYFGKPGPKTDINCTYFNTTFTAFNPKFDEPIPSWQRLEDDLYVYSVYNVNYQTYKEIRAIGFGTVNSISNVQCLIFFENESKPILGTFKFTPISKSFSNVEGLKYRGYHFICKYNSHEIPTGLTFVTKSNKYLDYAPIFPIKIQPQKLSNNKIAACVTQSLLKSMWSMDMVGFISFHALLGIDNFVIYDYGIPNEFNARLKELTNVLTTSPRFTYTVIPWNFPFMTIDQNIIKEIAETDCLYRAYNNVNYAIGLSWNEYIVLRYHRTIINLMANIKETEPSVNGCELKTTIFCTQQTDMNNKQYANTTLMVLQNTKHSTNIQENGFVYIYQPHKILQELRHSRNVKVTKIKQTIAGVNQYRYCDNKENQEEDVTILRFAQNIQNLWIFKKYREFYDASV